MAMPGRPLCPWCINCRLGWAGPCSQARAEGKSSPQQCQVLNLLVQGLPAKRKYSAITTYSPDMLRQRERKAKLFLVLTAARGRLDVVCEGNVRFSYVLQ